MATKRQNIIWLSIVSFVNDTASKMIVPLLPFFIEALGGTGLAIGLVSGIGESVAGMFKVVAGYWSDKLDRRKPFVFWGYFGAQISKLLLAIAAAWPVVLVLRTAERLGKGVRSAPRDSILAASTVKKTRGKWFGIHRTLDSAGAMLGSILAFVLYYLLNSDFKTIFLIAGGIGLLSVIPLFFVSDEKSELPVAKKTFGLQLKGFSRELKLFLAVAATFALGNFGYMFFVLRSQKFFSGLLSIGAPILLYALYNLSYTVLSLPAGKLSDKIGRRPVLMIGYGLYGVTSLGFLFVDAVWQLIVLFILYGVNYAFVEATERVYVSDLAPADARGTALGSLHTLISLAALPAGLIAGLLWDANPSYTFIYGVATSCIAVGLFMFAGRRS